VINYRTCGVVAAAALILSFLIGMVSRASMPMLIIRPLIFAVVFFVVSCVVNLLLKNFVPELLEGGQADDDPSSLLGTRIDITEGDSPLPVDTYAQGAGTAVPKPAFMGADDTEGALGDISNLLTKSSAESSPGGGSRSGMDQNLQDDYTDTGELEEVTESKPGGSFSGASFKEADTAAKSVRMPDLSGADVLPDLDSMAGAFLPADVDEEQDTPEYSVSPLSPKTPASKKAPGWASDFNAKDMAAGLRTVLSKDKEG